MSILQAFDYYFEMVPATTDALKQEVYKLRYQVYCLEKNFENPQNYVCGIEYDEFDQHSCHYLIRHRATQCYMATTRLILSDPLQPNKAFPIEKHSVIEDTTFKTVNRCHIAELSRFCVSKQFRRRAGEEGLIVTNDLVRHTTSLREKQSSAHLTLALFACAVAMSRQHNIHYWYAIMEPALKRVFSSLGVHFTAVGEPVDYHGLRIPCAIKVEDLLNSVLEKNEEYWRMLTCHC